MPRSPAPQWRRRKEPILDHLWHASIDNAGGTPDENGHYAELVYAGCDTKERAKEIKQALFRARKYLPFSGRAWIVKNGDTFDVHFHAITEAAAKKYMLEHYGPDRTKWPYSPFRKDANYNT